MQPIGIEMEFGSPIEGEKLYRKLDGNVDCDAFIRVQAFCTSGRRDLYEAKDVVAIETVDIQNPERVLHRYVAEPWREGFEEESIKFSTKEYQSIMDDKWRPITTYERVFFERGVSAKCFFERGGSD